MPDTELITIGAFARACGLSASALRFYADAGILAPADVDEVTGYRYYAQEQSTPAHLLRHLRAVDMPLPAVKALLTETDHARAIALLEHHLADLDRRQDQVRAAATAARGALRATHGSESGPSGSGNRDRAGVHPDRPRGPLATARDPEQELDPARRPRDDVWVSGPVVAAAIDQVATATVADPSLAVLDTMLFETDGQQLILTATDRYRLATRTVRLTRVSDAAWDATVDAEDLRAAVSWLRRRHAVAIRPHRDRIEFHTATTDSIAGSPNGTEGEPTTRHDAPPDDTRRFCRRSTQAFPDYRAMLSALAPVRTRVVLTRTALLGALERADSPIVVLSVDATGTVSVLPASAYAERATHPVTAATNDAVAQGSSTASSSASAESVVAPEIPSTGSTGPAMAIHFAVTTLYPAVATAVGPDVMLDLIAPDQPVLVRSADDGDLSTLVMPCRPEPTEETFR
ncbi:MerR family transcriptional regulator [Nocardia alba]|uniref:DNA-binding transcriptional MerR regulator n=1 Tax=Nocardia alba TaxID=225051 RepID=A0A4R1FPM2_9NOCA|nr:MerR family transcriptional regulator [Nocardia alba]TCJ95454.1 DNA-binding transcriptional MerR regulator [Nocardia alba]